MTQDFDIICIGSVLWDVIGRAEVEMRQGSDVGGRITRLPGGVAMNIAMTLTQFGMTPALLTHIGHDAEGDLLVQACVQMGMNTDFICRSDALPTDQYMAVEGANGLIAAIADAHSLEKVGDAILRPLEIGPIAEAEAPFAGVVALDGNLTADLLGYIAMSPSFALADLRIAPASPGKADRLQPFLAAGRGTVYVNLEEAGYLCGATFSSSEDAARALLSKGAARALVTHGAVDAVDADAHAVLVRSPPAVKEVRVTGAGDTFMAAHIAYEAQGASRAEALTKALAAAARYVSGKPAL